MTRVDKEELSMLKNDTAVVNLDELSVSLKIASRKIDTFANYSNRRLKGEGYDAIRDVAKYLQALCSTLANADEYAHSSIKSGTIAFINYMEGYDKLDDSKANNIADGLRYMGSRIGTLESSIKRCEDNELDGLNDQIEYWRSKYNELLKEYNKLKDLSEVGATTGACLDNINNDIHKIINGVSKMRY